MIICAALTHTCAGTDHAYGGNHQQGMYASEKECTRVRYSRFKVHEKVTAYGAYKVQHHADRKLQLCKVHGHLPGSGICFGERAPLAVSAESPDDGIDQADQHQPSAYRMQEQKNGIHIRLNYFQTKVDKKTYQLVCF